MKKPLSIIIIFLFSGLALYVFFFSLNQLKLRSSIGDAQKEHFKNWKELEFFPNRYISIVSDIEYDEGGEVTYLKMKILNSGEYLNEDYLCRINPPVKIGDTIYKRRDSYRIYKVDYMDTLKLAYDFCD